MKIFNSFLRLFMPHQFSFMFGLGGSKSKSKGRTSSEFAENIAKEQAPYLEDLWRKSGGLFDRSQQDTVAMLPRVQRNVANRAEEFNKGWGDQIQGGMYKDMGLQNRLLGSLDRAENAPSAQQEINSMIMGGEGNNYADAMKASYMQDAQDAQQQMLRTMDARAVASGMSGGSRHGTAIGEGMEGINRNLQSNLAKTGFETFDKDLNRKLQIAQQADSNNMQRQGLMANLINRGQNTQDRGLSNVNMAQDAQMAEFAPQMMPWEIAKANAQTLGKPIKLQSGKSKGRNSSSAFGFNANYKSG